MMVNRNDKQRPIISFIVTDYNIPEKYILACIESIISLNISPDEREIIVVDDGSDKSPMEVLAPYKEHINYVRQENKGLSEARNRGIELALGEYIQFVDGDDYLIKKGYDLIISQLKKYIKKWGNANNADILFFRETKRENPQTNIASRLKLFWWTSSKRFLKDKNIRASACCYLFKHKILKDLRFEKGIFHEDELFTPLLINNAEAIYFTSIKAYYYRQRDKSITNCFSEEHINKRLNDFLFIATKLNSLSKKQEHEQLRRRADQLCMDYLYNVAALTKDYNSFHEAVNKLRLNKLFPLPLRFYTIKYLCFSIVSRIKIGQWAIFKYIVKR